MPTYEYACKDCDHTFDAYQAFTDDALTECPECEGALKKLFGNVGISFKGSGFYKTDSREGAKKKAAESSSASEGGSKGSDSGDTSSPDKGSKDSKGSDSGAKSTTSDKGSKDSSSSSTKTPSSSSSSSSS
ncbi:MAG: FmdB family zinc ribbon protein [Iamia sp.]